MDNIIYMEELFAAWQKDRAAVDARWARYFESLEKAAAAPVNLPDETPEAAIAGKSEEGLEQSRIDRLLWAYREVGYLYSKLNPLGDFSISHSYLLQEDPGEYEKLTLDEFGISPAALDRVYFAGRYMKPQRAPLRDLIEAFRTTYCSSIGVEFLHIQKKTVRRWLIGEMETTRNHPEVSAKQRKTILTDLLRTEELEHFLNSYFLGQKRFSLEGSESLIPALHFLIHAAARQGIEDVIIGTTHRGRLSILTAILGMSAEELFARFDENVLKGMSGGFGDVKYHIGYETVHKNEDGGSVNVSLVSNSSHLESVGPVIEGIARAREDKKGDRGCERVIPVILHGDAAISGQGVVAETFNLSSLEGYRTGGTIHIVINNQIGFTTSSRNARSTFFPTDIAKMLQVPIFHVNGDDPESIVHVVGLALKFRREFREDCIIDIFCYRRHGHNEGDEPSFTHPHMYQVISRHPSVTALYGGECDQKGVMSAHDQEEWRKAYRGELKASLDNARLAAGTGTADQLTKETNQAAVHVADIHTGVDEQKLRAIAASLSAVPAGFNLHPKLMQIVNTKARLFAEKNQVDWAFAEALAFGTLVVEGYPVRLSGQDSERGTFSQRHLVWWDTQSPTPLSHTPLNAFGPDQAAFGVFDSPLSEYSVLGFEYGYSLVNTTTLTVWEAQFGDFSNGAQVVIDNYIACAERKWGQKSGLVLLLPHGSEGQGPDHSSAHLERFLQLCAQDNLRVCNPTTPAQYFHLLRRQALDKNRKPLAIMSPKSLLRHPMAVSKTDDLVSGSFEPVLDDPVKSGNVSRILLCSGKLYYDLIAERERTGASDTVIVRLEQLYPFPAEMLQKVIGRYPAADEIIWVQEEHKNYGAWRFIVENFSSSIARSTIRYLGRPEAASAATGKLKEHKEEQRAIVESAIKKEQ